MHCEAEIAFVIESPIDDMDIFTLHSFAVTLCGGCIFNSPSKTFSIDKYEIPHIDQNRSTVNLPLTIALNWPSSKLACNLL